MEYIVWMVKIVRLKDKVYEFTNYSDFGLFSIVRYSRKATKFQKLELFPSSGEGGRRNLLSWAP
jgi:hypothetical protein